MNRPRKYAHILPTPARSGQSSSVSSAQPTPEDRVHGRSGPSIACLACRARKTKCDGGRPTCSNCTKRGKATCVYLDKHKSGSIAMELLGSLKTLPKHRALMLLNGLRAQGDLATVLSEFSDAEQAIEELDTSSSLFEAELMATSPNTYTILRPIDLSGPTESHVLHPTNTHPCFAHSSLSFHALVPRILIETDIDPSEAIQYCDDRLSDLRVDFWTDVFVPSDFIARAISLYINTDHPLLGLFDTDLFITSLVDMQTRFCSRFLFHSLMYLACQMYSAFDKNSMQYAEVFSQAAEELWENEADSCLAMAGAVLLSVSNLGRGKDHDAVLGYARYALEMGQRLGLLSVEPEGFPQPSFKTKEEERFNSYGAWGTFNWNVMISQFYRQPSLKGSGLRPMMPIPGDTDLPDPESNIFEDGDVIDRGVLGITFPALCKFWLITHGARWIHLPDPPPIPDPFFRMSVLEHKYRQLLAWVETLSPNLLRTEESPHHTIVFHIWLHTTILDILQPFIRTAPGERFQLETFSAPDRSPDAAYAASVNQLKRLIFEYRSRYSASTYSILWHSGLIYLANAMIKHTRDPEWRYYLYLCVYGYERLNRPYRISEIILQGLLAMTLKHTDISADEAQRLMAELKKRGLDQGDKPLEARVRATFMVDLDLALTDPHMASVENVAADFDYWALVQSVVQRDQMTE
ncbi:hypothetical protein F5Y10DRAFT_289717 [Nemania abortiva]|nr:hypothetical protein F5Y10DRAFT_289717 [Nemania abortiva]